MIKVDAGNISPFYKRHIYHFPCFSTGTHIIKGLLSFVRDFLQDNDRPTKNEVNVLYNSILTEEIPKTMICSVHPVSLSISKVI